MKRWKAFVSSLALDQRTDFDEGDIGLPGGRRERKRGGGKTGEGHRLFKRFVSISFFVLFNVYFSLELIGGGVFHDGDFAEVCFSASCSPFNMRMQKITTIYMPDVAAKDHNHFHA